MPDGPGGFTQDSSCPALLRIPLRHVSLRIPGFHRLRRDFPDTSARDTVCDCAVLLPQRGRNPAGLGCSPVARHYWGNHCLFSLPQGTKMFQFPWFASTTKVDDSPSDCRVVPFGNPRINGHLRLPAAYRSLSRPSSPVRAKASAMRPFLLSLAQGPAAQAPVDYTFSFPLVSTSRDARKSRATRSMEIRFTFCFRFQYVKDPRRT